MPIREPIHGRRTDVIIATGTETSFTFDFDAVDSDWVAVYVNGETVTRNEETSNVTVTHNYSYDVVISEAGGGTVTFHTAPLNGDKIVICGLTPRNQESDYSFRAAIYPETISKGLDKLTAIAQEQDETLSRCVKYPIDADPEEMELDIGEFAYKTKQYCDEAKEAAEKALSVQRTTEFEVLATTDTIAAGSSEYKGIPLSWEREVVVGGQTITETYNTAVDIPDGMTEEFKLWVLDSEAVVDWGDGKIDKYETAYGSVTCSHTYATEGVYRVVVRANEQVRLTHSANNNLMFRCLEDDLPCSLASIQNFALNSQKLVKVARDSAWRVNGKESWNATFSGCRNLRSVTGFSRIETVANCKNIFEGCWNLIETDFRMPPLATLAGESYRYMYSNCRSLSVNIASLFPETGFAGNKIDLSMMFFCNTGYTVPLTGTVPAWMLWEDTTKTFVMADKANWAKYLPADIRAQIPVAWGGTADIVVPNKTTKEYVDNAVGEVDARVDGLEDEVEVIAGSVSGVAGRVTTIEGKIPMQASFINKLADKDFVNSSIENVAAYFITKDVAGNPFATKAELTGATVYYSGGSVRVPTRNDYCVVLKDESRQDPQTGEKPTTRYLYDNGWEFQYVVNNSGLTAAQWAAVNSGITEAKVAEIDNKADKFDVAGILWRSGTTLGVDEYVGDSGIDVTGNIISIDDETMGKINNALTQTVADELYAPKAIYANGYINLGNNTLSPDASMGSIIIGKWVGLQDGNTSNLLCGGGTVNISAKNCMAFGGDNNLANSYNFMLGYRLQSSQGQFKTTVGKYNAQDKNAIFIVGVGTATTARKNGFVVKESGHVEVLGGGTFGGDVWANGVKLGGGTGGGGDDIWYLERGGGVDGDTVRTTDAVSLNVGEHNNGFDEHFAIVGEDNKAWGEALAIGRFNNVGECGAVIGYDNTAGQYGAAIGLENAAGQCSLVVGKNIQAGRNCLAIGYHYSEYTVPDNTADLNGMTMTNIVNGFLVAGEGIEITGNTIKIAQSILDRLAELEAK